VRVPILTPTCHATKDESRIEALAFHRSETQALHHPGPEALDECITLRHQAPYDVEGSAIFEIDCDAAPSTTEHSVARVHAARVVTIDTNDLCAQVGEQHAGIGCGTDARKLDDLERGQRASGKRARGKWARQAVSRSQVRPLPRKW